VSESPPRNGNVVDVVELRIPCKPEFVAIVRLAIAAVAHRLAYSMDEIEDLKLAVAEACTNAIQHASESPAIDIRCELTEDELSVRVRDFGRGEMPEIKSRPLDEPRVGGLGVFLIRALMDEVTYDMHPGQGTELVMVKRHSTEPLGS
jgi:serine/threonine-protein kinase RsbW